MGDSGKEAAFLGVWDGTVDDHAANFVYTRCCEHHLRSAGFAAYTEAVVAGEERPEALAQNLAAAVREGYAVSFLLSYAPQHELLGIEFPLFLRTADSTPFPR